MRNEVTGFHSLKTKYEMEKHYMEDNQVDIQTCIQAFPYRFMGNITHGRSYSQPS